MKTLFLLSLFALMSCNTKNSNSGIPVFEENERQEDMSQAEPQEVKEEIANVQATIEEEKNFNHSLDILQEYQNQLSQIDILNTLKKLKNIYASQELEGKYYCGENKTYIHADDEKGTYLSDIGFFIHYQDSEDEILSVMQEKLCKDKSIQIAEFEEVLADMNVSVERNDAESVNDELYLKSLIRLQKFFEGRVIETEKLPTLTIDATDKNYSSPTVGKFFLKAESSDQELEKFLKNISREIEITAVVNVRKAPDTKAAIVTKAEPGNTWMTSGVKQGEWIQIYKKGWVGYEFYWVHGQYVRGI